MLYLFSMTVTPDHVRALADAYRKTLDAGDAIFQGDPLSRKTLVAIVVKSATTQSDWLETRVPNGGELKEDLEGLVSTLAKYDVVGANLASTKQWLRKQTIILIGAVCALVAWPAWVGIVVAWAGGILLGAYSLGYRLGLLLGSTLLMWLCMGVWKAATSKDFRRFLGMPKAIGLQESELFRSHALPALEAMRASHDGASVTGLDTPVVRELRVWAYLLLVLSVVIFVVVATQFVLGLLAAFSCKANAPVIDYPWTPEDDTKVCS